MAHRNRHQKTVLYQKAVALNCRFVACRKIFPLHKERDNFCFNSNQKISFSAELVEFASTATKRWRTQNQKSKHPPTPQEEDEQGRRCHNQLSRKNKI
jgi:hypothetical protein